MYGVIVAILLLITLCNGRGWRYTLVMGTIGFILGFGVVMLAAVVLANIR